MRLSIALCDDCFFESRQIFFQNCHYDVIKMSPIVTLPLLKNEVPRQYALRTVRAQLDHLQEIQRDNPVQSVLCGINTMVTLGRRIASIPKTPDEAKEMLNKLSGRRHRVLTSIILHYGSKKSQRQVETMVQWKRLSLLEINDYIAGKHYEERQGGYLPLEHFSKKFIQSINGSPFNLDGIPMCVVYTMLQGVTSSNHPLSHF